MTTLKEIINFTNFQTFLFCKLIKKIEKKFQISIYYFFFFRFLTRLFEIILFNKINSKFDIYSNYYLPKKIRKLKNLYVISAGIANDSSFEKKIIQKLHIKKMITVDPTQISKIEIKSIKSYKNKFINKPLSWETRNIKIYKPFDYKDNNINFSTNPMFGNALNFDYIKSVSIFDIIKNIKYNNKYPLLIKMDIEGIADLIITKLLEKRIFPNFIAFELERSTSIFDQINFFKKLIKLNTLLKKNYDTYYFTKQKIGYRLELISVKKRNIKFI